MKLFCLYLAAILIQPCPACWIEDVLFQNIANANASEMCDSPHCCCSCGCDSHEHQQQQKHEHQHDDEEKCPCQYKSNGMEFTQIEPPINMRGVILEISISIDESCCSYVKTTTLRNIYSLESSLMVPLRI